MCAVVGVVHYAVVTLTCNLRHRNQLSATHAHAGLCLFGTSVRSWPLHVSPNQS